jgi:3,4-dihydroxy 2-butanone 4-phosphate synthase/GTP cyclohydrolase II
MAISRNAMHLEEFPTVADVAGALEAGDPAIVVDDEAGTADLMLAAGRVSRAGIAFLATHARGLTELALSAERVATLRLPPMAIGWETPRKPFTVSIEASRGVDTGISARDRAETVRVAVADGASAEDLIAPGHVFPLRARPGGLAEVRGRVEAAVALARFAGCGEGAVLCPILDDTGDLAAQAALEVLAARFTLPRVSIAAIAAEIIGRSAAWSLPPPGRGALAGRVGWQRERGVVLERSWR